MPAAIQAIEWTPKLGRIKTPGLYSNLPLNFYHQWNITEGISVSSSALRKITATSPAHYWAESPMNPERVEPRDARHFVVGRAMHHLAFSEKYFAKLFCACPDEMPDSKGLLKPWSLRLESAKRWVEAREKEGRSPIYPGEIEQIKGMAASLAVHPLISKLGIFNGHIERSGFWRDEKTGLWLKIRPDVIPTHSGDFVDFKTTQSVLWNDLQRAIGDRGYHQQFSLMRSGMRALGMPFESATLAFIEKEKPHCVRFVELSTEDLDRGERQNRKALDTFAACIRNKRWPGPGDDRDVETIQLSPRVRELIDKSVAIPN